MKKRGHYCKVCGEYKANEKFSGKGHAAHICKTCAALPPEKQAEEMTLTRLVNLPWRLSKEQLSWLKKRMKDKRDAVRTLATEQYEIRFPPRIELDELEDDFEEDFDFYMDEETDIEKPMRSVMSRPLIFWKGGGPHMATTRIIPLHAGKGRTVGKVISDIIDYVKNPEKTDHGRLITSYQCDSRVADAQFLLDKQTYAARTGRVRGADDVIAYHLRQSFVPGEITPDEANRLGVELARRFTKGKHAFIVCTHIDKAHVHNHIIWNSTTLECDRKFRNFWGSTRAVHRLSDTICIENGYSIVEAPKRRGQSYNKWLGDAAKPSHKEQLRQAIDRALAQKPTSLEELLRLLEQDGFTVHRRGKTISIGAEGWGNNVRFDRLGDGYTLNDLLAVLSGQKEHTPRKQPTPQAAPPKVNLLVDIQAKLQAGKGAGYARWAKVFNLKQMAQTLNYLSEHGLLDYADLETKTAEATARYNALSDQIKAAEKRMAEIAVLRTHIVNYAKTRDTYVAYRKAGYSKKFRQEHEEEILLHQAAKEAFNELNVKKLPTIKELQTEYAQLLADKKKAYGEYRQARAAMRELLTVKNNVDRVLAMEQVESQQKEKDHGQR